MTLEFSEGQIRGYSPTVWKPAQYKKKVLMWKKTMLSNLYHTMGKSSCWYDWIFKFCSFYNTLYWIFLIKVRNRVLICSLDLPCQWMSGKRADLLTINSRNNLLNFQLINPFMSVVIFVPKWTINKHTKTFLLYNVNCRLFTKLKLSGV